MLCDSVQLPLLTGRQHRCTKFFCSLCSRTSFLHLPNSMIGLWCLTKQTVYLACPLLRRFHRLWCQLLLFLNTPLFADVVSTFCNPCQFVRLSDAVWMWTWMRPKNHVLDGGPDPQRAVLEQTCCDMPSGQYTQRLTWGQHTAMWLALQSYCGNLSVFWLHALDWTV